MSLKQCCATGSLHTGTPTGRVTKVHGLDCYIADSPNGAPKGIVVIIPDAFGWELPNNRILADEYAKNGFKVFLPEFMVGMALPSEILISFKAMSATGFWNQLYKLWHGVYLARYFIPFMLYCRPAVATPRILSFIKALKANEAKVLPIATAGFCWGGKFVTELCKDQVKADDGGRLTECGFTAHPSFLTYPDDIEGIVLPYSCAAAELEDPQMSPAQAKQTREILTAKTAKQKDQGIEHEFVMYEGKFAPISSQLVRLLIVLTLGTHHGFAVRADEDEKHEAAQGKKAEEQAVKWFSRWLSSPAPLSATAE